MFARHAVTATPLTVPQRLIIETLAQSNDWSVDAIVKTHRKRGRTYMTATIADIAARQLEHRGFVKHTTRKFDRVSMFSLTNRGLDVADEVFSARRDRF